MTEPRSPLGRLRDRLRGSAPAHEREAWRLGSGRAVDVAPEFGTWLNGEPVPAAVLVGLIEREADTSLLLTVRASQLRNHAGQISFPGGRLETGDVSPEDAALREASEEIGLERSDAEVLGFLPDHLVLTGYRVTPVIAQLSPDFVWTADEAEVEQVFELPWSVLDDEARVLSSERRVGPLTLPMREIHFEGHRIWGLTASILLLLRDLGRGGLR